MMPDLTLFDLEKTLTELMELRDSAETEEERKVAEKLLAEWTSREVTKVDAVRSYLKHCDYMAETISRDVEERKKYAQLWRDRGKHLRKLILVAMDAAGKKRLEGRTGYLMAKANGGVQAVEVRQPELVPHEYLTYEVKIPGRAWGVAAAAWPPLLELPRVSVPVLDDIRVALQQPCQHCGGKGYTSEYDSESGYPPIEEGCSDCGGTGKRGVPGCVLLPRGSHVEVK